MIRLEVTVFDSGRVRQSRAPVAQGIERCPPEACAQVRILPGAQIYRFITYGGRMTNRSPRIAIAVVAGLALAAGLGGCGKGEPVATPSATATTPFTVPTSSAEPTSILSGRPSANGPVLALKMDNTNRSLPHIGLVDADVVYIQQVEGGLSRLALIYSTTIPTKVAPIRSARETDAELLPMYGPIAFGFSGSVDAVARQVKRAGLIDVSAETYGGGYARLSSRSAPYNEYAKPAKLIKQAGGSAKPKYVGFTFGALPLGGRKATGVTITYPSARITFKYKTSTGRWNYYLGGVQDTSDQGAVSASTLVIQSVKLSNTGRDDVAGNPVPKSRTVGTGKAIAFRDGRYYKLTWSRPTVSAPTRWLYQGKDFPMKAGQVWVALLDAQRTPKFTGTAS